MKTHAEIVTILKAEVTNLRNRCGVAELSLVTRRIQFEPVAEAQFWVEFTAVPCVERLKKYLERLLAIKVSFLPKLQTLIEYKIITCGACLNPGQRIRELVEQRGWTDEEFAQLINIKLQGLKRIYAGKSHPDKIRDRILEVLRVPAKGLYEAD
jgi:DNA-binding transcriptional regulator YiaG